MREDANEGQDAPGTVLLFDVENLIGGYGQANFADQVDLRSIASHVLGMSMVGRVAVKRAYANWAHPGIRPIRDQVAELGIEPVQMFSLGLGNAKNASDIQIVIDAMDLALTRPPLTTFVIISGDGGFASLANRLRGHGKHVGGAAYERTSNRYFRVQCDEWVSLPAPQEPPPSPAQQRPSPRAAQRPWVTDPTSVAAAPNLPPLIQEIRSVCATVTPASASETLQATRAVLVAICGCPSAVADVNGDGLAQPKVLECLRDVIVGFQPSRAGVGRIGELLSIAATGTDIQVIRGSSGQGRLQRRGLLPPEGFEVAPDADPPNLHTPTTYRSILAAARRALPEEVPLQRAIDVILADAPPSPAEKPDLWAVLVSGLSCSEKDARTSLQALLTTGVLQPAEDASSVQVRLTTRDPAAARQVVERSYQEAMADLLPEFDPAVIGALLG